MADSFNPNAYYDYPYTVKTGADTTSTNYLSVRASDGGIRVFRGGSYSYYDNLEEWQRFQINAQRAVIHAGEPIREVDLTHRHEVERSAYKESQARYTTYKANVSSQQAAAARKSESSMRSRLGMTEDGDERRQLKKPTDGELKPRKGAKKGGVAALKKPVSGVAI